MLDRFILAGSYGNLPLFLFCFQLFKIDKKQNNPSPILPPIKQIKITTGEAASRAVVDILKNIAEIGDGVLFIFLFAILCIYENY